jgi:hypothetical protein
MKPPMNLLGVLFTLSPLAVAFWVALIWWLA